MPRTVGPRVTFWSRSELGLRAPKGRVTVPHSERDSLVVHFTTGAQLGQAQNDDWWRAIQNYHMGANGWNDVAYNFGFTAFGEVFEGRGWDAQGAHSPGWNRRGIGIAFLGDDDPGVVDITSAALDALRWLVAESQRHFECPLKRLGHRDTQKPGYTTCPGDELWKLVHDPSALSPIAPPLVVQKPKPRPVVPTPPKFLGTLRYEGSVRQSRAAYLWQRRMLERGWRLAADGLYGRQSKAVCQAFQREKRLVVDGWVGPTTWRMSWTSPIS